MKVEKSSIFLMCCIALIVTSMTFAIRAGILDELGVTFALSNEELGWINSMAFLGFPLAMMVGGLLYNQVGPKLMMIIAFIGHLAGLLLTIYATGFVTLLVSTFFIGLANGAVEAACNPLIADIYKDRKTAMLNRFHVWFPGGIVIGALIGNFFGEALGWQLLIATMLVPTVIYGYMIFKVKFPEAGELVASTTENVKALVAPLFLVLILLMTLTAVTELGTGQWINQVLAGSGASAMLILALITGVMAVGRYFAGHILHRINPIGVLFGSSAIATLGLFLLSNTSGTMVYGAAVVFAIGVTYFWPTMIGVVGEYLPKTGALGMSLMGGAGMFGVSIWNPVIGKWIDDAKATALAGGVSVDEADIVAGQAVLERLNVLPVILIVAFGILFFMKLKRPEQPAAQSKN